MLIDNPFQSLTVLAGPAILTNACTIMQNSASIRYTLAVTQWRELRASLTADDERLRSLYTDPARIVALSEQRVRHLLRGLDLLFAAVAMFGVTTFLALCGALFSDTSMSWTRPAMIAMSIVGGIGLAAMVAATVSFCLESATGRSMIRLHRHHADRGADGYVA